MSPRRQPRLAPAVTALPVPEPWLAEDRATLVGQRCGVRSTELRVERGGTVVYRVQLGHSEAEAAEGGALRGAIADTQMGLGGVGGGGVVASGVRGEKPASERRVEPGHEPGQEKIWELSGPPPTRALELVHLPDGSQSVRESHAIALHEHIDRRHIAADDGALAPADARVDEVGERGYRGGRGALVGRGPHLVDHHERGTAQVDHLRLAGHVLRPHRELRLFDVAHPVLLVEALPRGIRRRDGLAVARVAGEHDGLARDAQPELHALQRLPRAALVIGLGQLPGDHQLDHLRRHRELEVFELARGRREVLTALSVSALGDARLEGGDALGRCGLLGAASQDLGELVGRAEALQVVGRTLLGECGPGPGEVVGGHLCEVRLHDSAPFDPLALRAATSPAVASGDITGSMRERASDSRPVAA